MSASFHLEILAPGRELLRAEVTEVVLPAYDGEVGVFSDHEDFIGILGTGLVKIVRESRDYWFLVSGGIYEVFDGHLTIFAELAESAEEVDVEAAEAAVKELEDVFFNLERFSPEDYPAQLEAYKRNTTRIEIHRRTNLMN